MTDTEELELLRTFFKEVSELTLNHDVLEDHAVVYPCNLGPVLEKINKQWWKCDEL